MCNMKSLIQDMRIALWDMRTVLCNMRIPLYEMGAICDMGAL